jgi:hypothetical protein
MKKHLDGNLEKILNEMSSKGFELVCMETISNTFDVICVFRREKTN